jgi:hypothetical protein
MTTIGFHYFPDETHYRQADLQAWLPELVALEAKWVTLIGSLTRAVPEPFIRGLIDAGIEPIIHIPAVPTKRDSQAVVAGTLNSLFRSYARWGVRYVAAFNEPNMRSSWSPADWGQNGLVERFLDLLVPVLDAQLEAGLEPVYPVLRAGGDYWDTAFLEASLAGFAGRGRTDLARQLTFALNLWSHNQPLDWGKGGRRRWPDSQPYLTPPGSQDQDGFRLFEWYDEIIQASLTEMRPFICIAGGPRIGDQANSSLPAVDDLRHASCIHDIVATLKAGNLPQHLLNVNFWLLSTAEGSPFTNQAWYRPDGTTLTAVEAFKTHPGGGLPAGRRQSDESKALDLEHVAVETEKSLRHYVLMPVFEWGVSEWHWTAALDYVKAHRPVCGFSAEEASQARRVTILGNEQGISLAVEQTLRQAGCSVERINVAQAA